MKRKTSNAQRRTPNIEFEKWRMAEVPDGEYGSNGKPVYDLEDRLLKFAVNIIELTESLPNTRAGNHIAGFARTENQHEQEFEYSVGQAGSLPGGLCRVAIGGAPATSGDQ